MDAQAIAQTPKMIDLASLSAIAVRDGLGIVLAVANLIVLVLVVRWILRTGERREAAAHEREKALAIIINGSMTASTAALAALTKQIEQLDNHQTTFMEFLKNLNESVKERWNTVQKIADHTRQDIKDVNTSIANLKEVVVCKAKQ